MGKEAVGIIWRGDRGREKCRENELESESMGRLLQEFKALATPTEFRG